MSKTRHRPGEMLLLVLGSLFRKPATIRYPYAPFRMPGGFRGPPLFDSNRCIGCNLCIRDCPSQAIAIVKVGDKRFDQTVDLGRCVYCGQCAETCPRKAITISSEFELTQIAKGSLKVTYHSTPAPSVPLEAASQLKPADELPKGADDTGPTARPAGWAGSRRSE